MEPITGVIQNYSWGSVDALARLRGVPAPGEPEAEMWFGAHERGSSAVVGRDGRSLRDLIEADPVGQLGAETHDRFGPTLPYLVKLLAAAEPLSIQAHPDVAQARAGFEREDRAGVPRAAPNRSYRDPNHKPELIVALSDFEALIGFRPPEVSARFLGSLGVLQLEPMLSLLEADDLGGALQWALEDADAATVDAVVAACAVSDAEPHAELLSRLATVHPGDAGVLVAALLHRVVLGPGQGLFLGAGTLHSYVGGLGVEVMANSDNVLRGGLTVKPVDVAELLHVTSTRPTSPELFEPDDGVTTYAPPIGEFRLTRLVDPDRHVRRSRGPEIVLVTAGTVTLSGGAEQHALDPAQAMWVPASTTEYVIDGAGLVFVVEVGDVHSEPG